MNALMHAGLRDYLSPATPTSINAPRSNPRIPVGPDAPLPQGIRPIPNSSQQNKKSNAQIPYPRLAVNTSAFGGLQKTISEGDVAFIERVEHPKRRLATDDGKSIRVYTLEQVNAKFADTLVTEDDGKALSNVISVDGVINNVDGLDTNHEFRDYAMANVAIQGPCRLSVTPEETRRVSIGDVLYIGISVVPTFTEAEAEAEAGAEAAPIKYKLQLVRFFSCDVTRMNPKATTKTLFAEQFDTIKYAWSVGRIIDTNQSHKMMTINVGIDLVRETADAMLDEMTRTLALKEGEQPRAPGGPVINTQPIKASVRDQLWRRWRRADGIPELPALNPL